MKGHVKLELFDENGSLVQKREDHNMMTNFMNDYLLPIWGTRQLACGASPNYLGAIGEIHKYFGTLQLFADVLSEDPNDFLAGGQKVVGLSRLNLGYVGKNTLYGSYNDYESGWSDDGKTFKYVYDFSTSQGNGNIASLGLSTIFSAEAGFGVDATDTTAQYSINGVSCFSNQYRNDNKVPYSFNTLGRSKDAFLDFYFDYENNFEVCCRYEVLCKTSDEEYIGKTSKIPILFKRIPLSKAMVGYNIGWGVYPTFEVVEQKEITLKNTLNSSNVNYGFLNYCDGKIYACFSNSQTWKAGTSLIVTCIDTDTWEESYITVTNTTGKTIYLKSCKNTNNNYCNVPHCTFCTGDYLLVMDSTSYYMYTIDLNDNTNVKQVVWESGEVFDVGTSYVQFIAYANGIAYFTNSSSSIIDDTTCYGVHIPTAKGKTFGTNYNMFFRSYTSMTQVKNHPQVLIGWDDSNQIDGTHNMRVWCLPSATLSTKMNLEEPVVKTADLTMKVTYSLTFKNDV